MLDEYMERVLLNKNKVPSTVPALPDIKETFAIGSVFADVVWLLSVHMHSKGTVVGSVCLCLNSLVVSLFLLQTTQLT